ncbi:MAG: glycosyltransferase [Planctomycetia bacterium]|nr:glycosyltransferase [Planctomycetia bacterium]
MLATPNREIDVWDPGTAAVVDGAPPARVCFLIDRLSKAGTESQLLALLRHLDRRRVQPVLALLRGDDAESRALEPDDCPVQRLAVGALRRPATWKQLFQFANWLKRQRIDVLQVYFPDSTHFGVAAAKLAGVRVVRTRFNLGYWMKPLDRWLGRLHNRLADATIANCEACRQAAIMDEWAKPSSVHVVENGVDLERFAAIPLPDYNVANCPVRIGMVANLRPIKEPHLLIEAAARLAGEHPDLEFHLAGEGELRPELELRIAAHGLQDRFVLHGRVQDVAGFLAGIDLAVLCSRSEGSPNSVLEYMAAGRGIVATAVGGTRQLIEDGVHGLLTPVGDADSLAAALQRLLRDPAQARAMGQAARQRAWSRHDLRVRARRYEAFYQSLLAN